MGRPYRRLILALLSLGLLLLAAAPQASAGLLATQRVEGAASPTVQDASARGPASLTLGLDSTYSPVIPFTPAMTGASFHLDDDFLITPGATPQCDPAAPGFSTSTTAAALAACGGAYLGEGAFNLTGPVDVSGITSAFNGTPSGGLPQIIVHARSDAATTTILVGTLAPSGAGPDFGQRLDVTVPVLPLGLVFEHLDFELGEPGTPSALTYVTARCADGAAGWNFGGAFIYNDASGRSDSDSQKCTLPSPAAVPLPPTATSPATTPTKAKSKKKKKKKKKRKK